MVKWLETAEDGRYAKMADVRAIRKHSPWAPHPIRRLLHWVETATMLTRLGRVSHEAGPAAQGQLVTKKAVAEFLGRGHDWITDVTYIQETIESGHDAVTRVIAGLRKKDTALGASKLKNIVATACGDLARVKTKGRRKHSSTTPEPDDDDDADGEHDDGDDHNVDVDVDDYDYNIGDDDEDDDDDDDDDDNDVVVELDPPPPKIAPAPPKAPSRAPSTAVPKSRPCGPVPRQRSQQASHAKDIIPPPSQPRTAVPAQTSSSTKKRDSEGSEGSEGDESDISEDAESTDPPKNPRRMRKDSTSDYSLSQYGEAPQDSDSEVAKEDEVQTRKVGLLRAHLQDYGSDDDEGTMFSQLYVLYLIV